MSIQIVKSMIRFDPRLETSGEMFLNVVENPEGQTDPTYSTCSEFTLTDTTTNCLAEFLHRSRCGFRLTIQ